jgi:DNA mismatch repair protein MutL
MHFTQSEQTLVDEYRGNLQQLGFKFEGRNVTHVPALFQDRNPQELIKSLLDDLASETGLKSIDTVSEEMLAFLACRAAVKAGDILTEEQMKKIIVDLGKTHNNITCPHGRPTRVLVTIDELDSLFKR